MKNGSNFPIDRNIMVDDKNMEHVVDDGDSKGLDKSYHINPSFLILQL